MDWLAHECMNVYECHTERRLLLETTEQNLIHAMTVMFLWKIHMITGIIDSGVLHVKVYSKFGVHVSNLQPLKATLSHVWIEQCFDLTSFSVENTDLEHMSF